jgi:oxygen-independent coproporphyrinogen-3 oxidase
VDHLSIYALAFEPATPLGEDLQAGRTAEVAEDLQRAFYYDALEAASAANLEHYEISNLARPGMRCRHNLTYWHNIQYVGLGPGAASYIDGVRRKTRPDLSAYLQAAATGCPPPAEAERLTAPMAMAEALMLGLRLVGGVNRRAFADRYGRDPVQAFAHSVDKHLRMGSIIVTPDVIKIARDSFFVSDAVLADIVAEGQLFSGRPPDVLNTPPHRTDKRT